MERLQIVIDDSVEITIRYIHNMVQFIENLLVKSNKLGKPLCPFMIDFVIVYNKPLGIYIMFKHPTSCYLFFVI